MVTIVNDIKIPDCCRKCGYADFYLESLEYSTLKEESNRLALHCAHEGVCFRLGVANKSILVEEK